MATINEALKSLILALGGDPESMYDNTTVSDYIKDLETAMQAGGSGVKIDDTTASESTVYSSTKTEELINDIETLPSVAVGDIGEALIVESDGEGGAQWGKGAVPSELPSVTNSDNSLSLGVEGGVWTKVKSAIVFEGTVSGTNITFPQGTVLKLIDAYNNGVVPIVYDKTNKRYYYPSAYGTIITTADRLNFIWQGFASRNDFTNKVFSVYSIAFKADSDSSVIETNTVTLT